MISINQVRNTVMFLLEKNNKGYITPLAFDSFCQLAQLDIFEQLFYDLDAWVNKENRRLTNSEYANIPRNIREQIDIFAQYTTPSNFTYNLSTNLWSYTGNDFYRNMGISLVNSQNKKVDIELISKSEANLLNNSNINSPDLMFPVYTQIGDDFRIFPSVPTGYTTEMFYIRTPKAPKWTYVNVQGNPVYNGSASDLQNIELNPMMFSKFVVKVLSYCGLSLREEQVLQSTNSEEVKNIQLKS